MLVYFLFIVLTLVLSIKYDGQTNYSNAKKAWYIIVGIYLILLAGFRNGVGGDTQKYMQLFEYVPTTWGELSEYIYSELMESSYMPGWSVFVFLCKRWFDSFYAVQLIQAIVVNIGILYLFRQYTTHIFLCALLYGLCYVFFMFNMEVMREAFAVVFCGIGMDHYLRGDKWKFYLLVSISVLFHVSALVVLFFPLAHFKQITFKTLVYAFFTSVALFLLSDALVSYLPVILGSGVSRIVEKILSYSEVTLNFFGFLQNAIPYLIINAGILYFAQFSLGKDEQSTQYYTRYMSFYLIISVLICSFIGFSRFKTYTFIFYIIMLTEFIYHLKSQLTTNALLKTLLLIGMIYHTSRYYLTYYPYTNAYKYEFFYPYTSILNENVDTSKREAMHNEALENENYSRTNN